MARRRFKTNVCYSTNADVAKCIKREKRKHIFVSAFGLEIEISVKEALDLIKADIEITIKEY